MRFRIEGTQTKTKKIVVTETIRGEIEITKKEVQRITDCPNIEDGDSTAWYGYVAEALEGGATYKLHVAEAVVLERDVETDEHRLFEEGVDVEWG